ARAEEWRQVVQGPVVVRSDLHAQRSRRDVLAAPLAGRTARLLAPRAVRRAGRGGALLRRREVPRPGVQGDDPDLPRAPAVDSRHPAVRGLRAAKAPRVDAEPQPAVRDPPLRVQVPPRLGAGRPGPRAPAGLIHACPRHLPRRGLTAFVFAVLVAVPAGVVSAVRRNTVVDQVAMGVALVGQSAPTFFLGILFILTLSLRAGLLPTSGRGDWTHIVLPALTLGAFAMASIARLTRSALLEVLRQDYVRTARAKGLREWRVVAKHAFRSEETRLNSSHE